MNEIAKRLRFPLQRDAVHGYTLLEMLIVLVLLSVLMVGVWTMFRNWSRLYARGERRTREAQLVRSLSDQLEDDLHAVTYRPPAGRHAGSGRRSRRRRSSGSVALVGEKDWMVLDILQSVNPYDQPRRDPSDEALDPQSTGTVSAPECQRVIYQFRGRTDDLSSAVPMAESRPAEDMIPPFYGLIRLAIARESVDPLLALGSSSGDGVRRRTAVKDAVRQICDMVVPSDQTDMPAMPPPEEDLATSNDPAAMGRPDWLPGIVQQDELPEIGWFEFRYFDGGVWQESWDSRAEGRLPVAVEIRFEVVDLPAEPEVASESELLDGTGQEDLSAEQAADKALLDGEEPLWSSQDESFDSSGAADDQPPPYHRCIVYLEPPKEWPALDETTNELDGESPP